MSSLSREQPLGGLIVFLICRAVAGTVIAGGYYYAVDLPAHTAQPVPANSDCNARYYSCQANCPTGYGTCCCCSVLYNCGISKCPDRCT